MMSPRMAGRVQQIGRAATFEDKLNINGIQECVNLQLQDTMHSTGKI